MIYEPPKSNVTFSASSPSSSSPSSPSSSSFSDSELGTQRDRNHNIDDELENQLADLRDSFDDRADELRRRTTRFRASLDVATRIRAQPLAAVAIGAAVGGAVALIRPMGRASTSLVAMVATRALRFFIVQMAERAYHELVNGSNDVGKAEGPAVPGGPGGDDVVVTNGLQTPSW